MDESQTARMIREAATNTDLRKQKIMRSVRDFVNYFYNWKPSPE